MYGKIYILFKNLSVVSFFSALDYSCGKSWSKMVADCLIENVAYLHKYNNHRSVPHINMKNTISLPPYQHVGLYGSHFASSAASSQSSC